MRTAQQGDRVQVHYVKRLQYGSVTSSRGRSPLQMTIGIDPSRLPGLGLALVGLAPGTRTTLQVPTERAYGVWDPARVQRWSRKRFPGLAPLRIGKWVRFTDGQGRRRLVRILEVNGQVVLVDTNHRWAGQALELEVELLAIDDADAGADSRDPHPEQPACLATGPSCAEHPTPRELSGVTWQPKHAQAITFDVDVASLTSLREALPGWKINDVSGATATSLPCDWNPGAADLLVVGVRADVSETLGLCRFLAFSSSFSSDFRHEAAETGNSNGGVRKQARRTDAPILVLVPPGQEAFVRAALEAGAQNCLTLPIHPKEVASMLAHAGAGNQPGRHTLNLDPAQRKDRWRDDGGQG
jgi:FKBP-type peptidyl-prolyl cis-trans isomerase 2/CheY-like chemotaxis protein